jgi:hypothetical protein
VSKVKKSILVSIVFFCLFVTVVDAQETIGLGSVSRVPMWDNTIEQDYFFDGSNYIMITKYGNYTWLQPNNIMEYHNLDGIEVIDKSVWVLQYNKTGTWLSLLDFVNQKIDLVNETFYEISYGVNYRWKGKNYVVGNVSIGFYSSGYSMNKPKIIVNFTKSVDWDIVNGGLGSFQWIYNVIPKGNYFKYVNATSGEYIDIRTTDVIGNSDRIHLTDKSIYSDTDNWISVDVSDYGIIPFKGGDEDYYNGKGFSLTFPVNEGYIDPTTISTGFDGTSTAIEQQRKVFSVERNTPIDFYSGRDSSQVLNNNKFRVSQGFYVETGFTLVNASVYMLKTGLPTGNAKAILYSVVNNTSLEPNIILTNSTDTIDVSTLTGSYQLVTFNISWTLNSNEFYSLVVEYEDGDAINYVHVGSETSGDSQHYGISYDTDSIIWVKNNEDLIFRLNSPFNSTFSRLYISLFEKTSGVHYFYVSPDSGITWFSGGGQASTDTCDLTYWYNETSEYIYVYQSIISGSDARVNIWSLSGLESNLRPSAMGIMTNLLLTATDDGVFNANIELDDDGYLWLSGTDEYTKQGKQRNDIYAVHTQTTYPIAVGVTASAVLKVYDGSSTIQDPTVNAISELSRLYATSDVGLVYFVELSGSDEELYAKTITRASPLSGTPTGGNQVSIDSTPYTTFSSIGENETNSDVFITQASGASVVVYEWDISGDSVSTFDTINTLSQGVSSHVISILDGTPDELYVSILFNLEIPVHIAYGRTYMSNVSVADFSQFNLFLTDGNNYHDYLSVQSHLGLSIPRIWTNLTSPYEVHFSEYTFPVPYVGVVTHISLEVNETQIDDYEVFELKITLSITDNTENFSRNILTFDPTGLALNLTYLNGTGFSELYDPNNYITLDDTNSNKTDISTTQLYVKYVIYIHENITKEGWYDVKSWSNETYQGANDTDTYSNVFNLTIRVPTAPTLLYGAGFQSEQSNLSYVSLLWTHSGVLTDGYEIYNSTDKASWGLLGTSTTTNFTDNEVLNMTQRYYRVRAYRTTGVGQKNTTYTDINYEEVTFIAGAGTTNSFGWIYFIWVGVILIMSVGISVFKR